MPSRINRARLKPHCRVVQVISYAFLKKEHKEKLMTTFILLGYVAVIVISYKGAVFALDKSGLL
jgi:diphthamide synthase (EF-2-diphthine--ammonia ligase)